MLVLKNILREFVLDIWNGPVLRSAHTLYAHTLAQQDFHPVSPHTLHVHIDCRFIKKKCIDATSTKLSF